MPRLFLAGPDGRTAPSSIAPELLVEELTSVLEAAGAGGPGG
jgi:hypothetical protein